MGKLLFARIWHHGGNACLPNYPVLHTRARAFGRDAIPYSQLSRARPSLFMRGPCQRGGMLYPLRGKAQIDSGSEGKINSWATSTYEIVWILISSCDSTQTRMDEPKKQRAKQRLVKILHEPISVSSLSPLTEDQFFTLDLRESSIGVGGFSGGIHIWHDEYFHLPIPMPSTPYPF